MDAAIAARVADFRLDSQMRELCAGDIEDLCAFAGDVGAVDPRDAGIVACLQDYKEDIRAPKCKARAACCCCCGGFQGGFRAVFGGFEGFWVWGGEGFLGVGE